MTSDLKNPTQHGKTSAVKEGMALTIEALKNVVRAEKRVQEGFTEAETYAQNLRGWIGTGNPDVGKPFTGPCSTVSLCLITLPINKYLIWTSSVRSPS